jgi:hypothetical protein
MAIRTGSSQEIDLAALPAGPGPAKVQFANIFENVGTFDNPNFRNVDWNVVGGGGLAYGRSSLRFVLDTRYELGLAGIYPDSKRSWAHNGAWITTLGVELKK